MWSGWPQQFHPNKTIKKKKIVKIIRKLKMPINSKNVQKLPECFVQVLHLEFRSGCRKVVNGQKK